MPVLKHAKKKLRQDKERTLDNLRIKKLYKKLVKEAKEKPSAESLSKAFQAIDKAAKKNVLHDNKAARLKSALTKATAGTPAVKATPVKAKKATKAPKKAAKKTAKK